MPPPPCDWISAFRKRPAPFALAAGLLCLVVLLFGQGSGPDLERPPVPGDGPDYDMLAWQLSRGEGFTVDYGDPEFRRVYSSHDRGETYRELLARDGKGTTAMRPPLFPVMMAGLYHAFGRNFATVRRMNALFAAATGGLLAYLLIRAAGVVAACAGVVLHLLDPRTTWYASRILTESLATFIVLLMAASMIHLARTARPKTAFVLGVLCGLAFLTRSILLLWFPVVFVFTCFVARSSRKNLPMDGRRYVWVFLLAGFLLSAGPWMIRNCRVMQSFSPSGSMGRIQLPAGYSDEAALRKGVWFNPVSLGFYPNIPVDGLSQIEREKAWSDAGSDLAGRWARSNLLQLPGLFVHKTANLWATANGKVLLLYGLSLVGIFSSWKTHRSLVLSLLTLLLACTLGVGLTWTVGDRFLVPVLPIVWGLSALGVSSICQRFSLPGNPAHEAQNPAHHV